MAWASRCEKAAAFAGSIAICTTQRSSWRLPRRARFVRAKILANYVRLRKSTQRGGVDMRANVSAICARAGHELRPLRWSLHRAKPGIPGFTISQRPASPTTADPIDVWQSWSVKNCPPFCWSIRQEVSRRRGLPRATIIFGIGATNGVRDGPGAYRDAEKLFRPAGRHPWLRRLAAYPPRRGFCDRRAGALYEPRPERPAEGADAA